MSTARRCAGFVLVGAIFLLVALGALGAYMVTISGVQQATTSHVAIASRVYYGAKSGLEWAIRQALITTTTTCTGTTQQCDCFTNPTVPTTTFVPVSFTLTGPALDGITVRVICSYASVTENNTGGSVNNNVRVYDISSEAASGAFGNPDYARRRLEATVSNRYGP